MSLMSIEKAYLKNVHVSPGHLIDRRRNRNYLLTAAFIATTLFAIRTFVQIQANPAGFNEDMLILKAFLDQVLTGVQMGTTPPNLHDPALLSLDTAAGAGIATSAAALVTGGVAYIDMLGRERRIKEEIFQKGRLENPLGLVGHTILLSQTHPFLNGILDDCKRNDHIDTFLVSRTGASQFNPYDNKAESEPATRFWKSTTKPYDDSVLEIADLNSASKMVILATQTDNLILSNKDALGLPQAHIENMLVNTYKLRKDIKTLLILPSRTVIDDEFKKSLENQGVPLDKVSIVVLDDLVAEEIKRKAKGEGIGLDVGSYTDEMRKLLTDTGLEIKESDRVIVYDTEDGEVLRKARRHKAGGKKPTAIIDTKEELSEVKREGIDYVCIESLMRKAIGDFNSEVSSERKTYPFRFSRIQRVIVSNDFEPLGIQMKAARDVVIQAIKILGKDEFFRLTDLIPRVEIEDMRRPHRELSTLSHHYNQEPFRYQPRGKNYTLLGSNSSMMKRATREMDNLPEVRELANEFFGYQVDKKTVNDISLIIQSLYVLGFVYKKILQFNKYGIARYPITMRTWLPKVGLCEADD